MSAPSCAYRTAMAFPMPRAEPVTSATLPLRSAICVASPYLSAEDLRLEGFTNGECHDVGVGHEAAIRCTRYGMPAGGFVSRLAFGVRVLCVERGNALVVVAAGFPVAQDLHTLGLNLLGVRLFIEERYDFRHVFLERHRCVAVFLAG